jgi:hypothetical protein
MLMDCCAVGHAGLRRVFQVLRVRCRVRCAAQKAFDEGLAVLAAARGEDGGAPFVGEGGIEEAFGFETGQHVARDRQRP